MDIKFLYNQLISYYKTDDWWPTIAPNKVFEIAIGAVLTQNTSWRNVEISINSLYKANLLNPESLYNTNVKKLESLIKHSGFYKRKAKTLKLLAEFFLKTDYKNIDTKTLREKLLSIKGIGRETADSILLYAFNRHSFVVDLYTFRLFKRTSIMLLHKNFTPKTYEKIKSKIEPLFTTKQLQKLHAGIVEHSKTICKSKPLCEKCFLNSTCKKNFI